LETISNKIADSVTGTVSDNAEIAQQYDPDSPTRPRLPTEAAMTTQPTAGAPGERSTRQKRALAQVLEETSEFLSAQSLHASLRGAGERVGLTTVYNQLRALSDSGEIDTFRSPVGEILYRRCRKAEHHHHIVCRSCGRTVEIQDDTVESWAAGVAKQAGFSDVEHTVEIVGTCRDCRQA
jgi:Fur family ferric uptake transcriptional regulator